MQNYKNVLYFWTTEPISTIWLLWKPRFTRRAPFFSEDTGYMRFNKNVRGKCAPNKNFSGEAMSRNLVLLIVWMLYGQSKLEFWSFSPLIEDISNNFWPYSLSTNTLNKIRKYITFHIYITFSYYISLKFP